MRASRRAHLAGPLLLVLAGAARAEDAATATAPTLTVTTVQIRGNRRIEDDAIRAALRTHPGVVLTQDLLRQDVRALWALGVFEDVRVEIASSDGGVAVAFVVRERPVVRRIFVSGNEGVDLAKINRVLDLRRGQVLDPTRLPRNARKIRHVFLQQGYFNAEVTPEVRPGGDDQADVYFRIVAGHRVEVRVRFIGNRAVSDSVLRAVMATREPDLLSVVTQAGTFRQEALERDVLVLQGLYLDRGYLRAQIGPPRAELSPDKRTMIITIPIDEGPQYRVGGVGVSGELVDVAPALLARVPLRPGQVFSRSALSAGITALTDSYKDRGHAYATVAPLTTVHDDELLVDVTLDIRRGPPVTIERIEIRGNSRTRDKVIRRQLRIAEGNLYSESRIEASRQRVQALGYFDRVDLTSRPGTAGDRIVLTVQVQERSTGTFQLGAGLSSVESFILQAQVGQNNLFGRGQDLAFSAQISALRRLFELRFSDPYFLDTNWTFGFSIYNQQRAYLTFLRSSLGGTLTWGYLLRDDLRLLVTYLLERVDLSAFRGGAGLLSAARPAPVAAPGLAGLLRSGLTSAPELSLVHDTRDNRLLPTRGWYNTASVQVADPYLASQNTFARVELGLRAFRPLWGPLTLRVRVEGGLVKSRDSRGVPLFERYFVGGIYDVRGFAPRSLGPRVRSSEVPGAALFPVGGNAQLIANAELEFPLLPAASIRGVLFVDAGNAFNLEDQFCGLRPDGVPVWADPCHRDFGPGLLRYSWGFGVRWLSLIGPLHFEWGVPFRTFAGEEPIVFEFTIGTLF